MRLTVLGCAGSFPGPDSAASGYLVQADDADGRTWSLLLDLGNGALSALQRYGDPTRLDAIGLSHLHSDHVADMMVLNVLRRYHPDGPFPRVPVYGPVGTAERLAQMSGKDPATSTDGQFEIVEWQEGSPVTVGPLVLDPVRVEHPIPAVGVRVSGPSDLDPGRTVTLAYTGDTDSCAGLETLAAGADLLLSEAGYLEGRDDASRGVHLTGRRAADAATRGGARRLVLTHIPPWNDPAITVTEATAAYSGPIELARPGGVHVL
jgi:ribonuclease BN (tRNA processing enzyme)